jgi:hypothetical protein
MNVIDSENVVPLFSIIIPSSPTAEVWSDRKVALYFLNFVPKVSQLL